jgi:hypothetical protein
MSRFYVAIKDIDDDKLSFLGYTLIRSNSEFKFYRDYAGNDHIVLKSDPHMFVDDINDAIYINSNIVIIAPPK